MSEKRFTMKYSYEDEEYVIYDEGNPLTPSRVVKKLNEQQDNINQQKETIDYMNERITELLAYIKHLKNGTERVKEIDGKIFIMM